MENSCIVDNWSLFLVSNFLRDYPLHSQKIIKSTAFGVEMEQLSDLAKSFGALSNVLNAIIFYDRIYYLENGSEISWKNFPYFEEKSKKLFFPKLPPEYLLQLYNTNNPKNEAEFYLLTAKLTGNDLFVSPYRSDIMLNSCEISFPSITESLFSDIDGKISDLIKEEKDNKLKVGIESNQIIPSLTQLVLNESNNITDVFDIAIQLKESEYIKDYKNKILEIINSKNKTKNYIELKKDLETVFDNTICKLGLKKLEKNKSFEASFNLWIFTISNIKINYTTKIFRNKKHLILLKNIAKCRLEMYNSLNSLNRIMK